MIPQHPRYRICQPFLRFLDPEIAPFLQFLDPEFFFVNFYNFWIQKLQYFCGFWIQKLRHFYHFWIQNFFCPFLQFLDPEIVGPLSRFLNPEAAVFLQFLDPELAPFLPILGPEIFWSIFTISG